MFNLIGLWRLTEVLNGSQHPQTVTRGMLAFGFSHAQSISGALLISLIPSDHGVFKLNCSKSSQWLTYQALLNKKCVFQTIMMT